MTITDEAVEAAAKAMVRISRWEDVAEGSKMQLRADARLALEAASANRWRTFTDDDLFIRSNDPEDSDYRKGIECQECGAAVINTDRHVAWHNGRPTP